MSRAQQTKQEEGETESRQNTSENNLFKTITAVNEFSVFTAGTFVKMFSKKKNGDGWNVWSIYVWRIRVIT